MVRIIIDEIKLWNVSKYTSKTVVYHIDWLKHFNKNRPWEQEEEEEN